MRVEDRVRITHMVEACESAARFMQGRSRADLGDDQMLLFAVIRAVEIIGEAASKVSVEGRAACPKIAWKAIIGMRNRLVQRNKEGGRRPGDIRGATHCGALGHHTPGTPTCERNLHSAVLARTVS